MLGNHCTISDSIANQLVSSGMNFDRKYGEVSPIAPESTDVCQSLNIENLSTFIGHRWCSIGINESVKFSEPDELDFNWISRRSWIWNSTE